MGGFLSSMGGLGDLLQKISSGNAAPHEQFDQAAQAAPQSSLAEGIASALGSGGTGQFAQMATQLFTNGNGDQKSSMLNSLLATAGPGLLAQLSGNGAGGGLASLLGGGATSVTPAEAANVSPQAVQELAAKVHQADQSIVDKLGEVYSAHPDLFKTLGAAAMSVAVAKIAQKHRE
jgi:hypothetical protein